jgi:glycosyltransferase involved in cell wall biosynthesis
MKTNIFVKGPVLSQSGYGEQARFALRALRSREDLFDIYILPINWGKTGWIWENSEFRSWMDERIAKTQVAINNKSLKADVSLQITIPNEFEKICPVNIGYTAGIEATKCSPQWLPKGNEMDRIIVVSNHAKNSYKNTIAEAINNDTGEKFEYKLNTDIEVVGECTPRHEPEPIEGFELDYDKNFLMVSQLGPRKNLENSVCWFVEEFIDKKVGLVLKTNFKNNSISDFSTISNHLSTLLEKYKDRKCKVYLLHGDLKPSQMTWLYQHKNINALVNASHGEGFGLPLFEAAREGMPVVTLGWSGQLDFLHHDGDDYFQSVDYTLQPIQPQAVWPGVLEKEAMWAFADQGSYKMTLRKTLRDYRKVKQKAQKLKTIIDQKFSEEKLYADFIDALQIAQPEEETQVVIL